MNQALQVLIVEDSENDAALLEIQLQRAGYEPNCHRVDTSEAMKAALDRQSWDLVIADYVMPRFNGLAALALVKSRGLDLPFIIVSGHITDQTAVEAMRSGAHDYVMKDNLARLGPAVQRELREAKVRHERRRADEKLKAEQVFREAIEDSVPAGIAAVDLSGRQTYVNPAFCSMVGWTEAELVGARPPFVYWPPQHLEEITAALERAARGEMLPGGLELPYRRRTGERIAVLVQITPLKDAFNNITGWVSAASDITARKRAASRLATEHAITRLLANAGSLEEAASGMLQALLEGLEVDFGAWWVPAPDQQSLVPSFLQFRSAAPALEPFLQATRSLKLPHGEGLPGRIWQERQHFCAADLSTADRFPRTEVALQAGLRSALAFPIQNEGHFFGVLEFFAGTHLECDPDLANMMAAIGSEIGQFIQRRNAEAALRRAHAELELRVQQRTAELKAANVALQAAIAERQRLEHELLEITEQERRRIGLDLHDDLGQKLSGIAMMTKGLELKLAKADSEDAESAGRIHALVQEAMSHASDLAQEMAMLDLPEHDLPSALERLANHTRELFGIACRANCEGNIPSLDSHVMTQLYKIAQEAVTNAIKHGKAKRVALNLSRQEDTLLLSIQNNGLPFPHLEARSTGMGLRIMNYRANLIGGSLQIRANGGRGALVTCSVPLQGASQSAPALAAASPNV